MSKQLRLALKCRYQSSTALHRAESQVGVLLQVFEVFGAEVQHGMQLQRNLDVLNRVELRSIRWQKLKDDRTVLLVDVPAHELRSMSLKAIPDDPRFLTNRGVKRLEKLNHLDASIELSKKAKVEAYKAHLGNCRQMLPGKDILKNGRFAFRHPGTCPTGRSDKPESSIKTIIRPRCAVILLALAASCASRSCLSSRPRIRPSRMLRQQSGKKVPPVQGGLNNDSPMACFGLLKVIDI